MHYWGDKDFDWAGLDTAIDYLNTNLLRYRVDVRQAKEKFGTARIYCSLGLQWWPQLTHPGHVYNRWPRWLNFVIYPKPWSPFAWGLRAANIIIVPFHKWLYRYTYAQAIRRWPHLRKEILTAADWSDLLKGL